MSGGCRGLKSEHSSTAFLDRLCEATSGSDGIILPLHIDGCPTWEDGS